MIMFSTNSYQVACCKDLIEISLQYWTLDSIKHKLVLECFYSSGLDCDEDYLSWYVNMTLKRKIDSFLFFCQRIILDDVSSELHTVPVDMLFYFQIKIMEFQLCYCLFEYYFFKVSTILLSVKTFIKRDIGYSFTLCTINSFIPVCYGCVHDAILIADLNLAIVMIIMADLMRIL